MPIPGPVPEPRIARFGAAKVARYADGTCAFWCTNGHCQAFWHRRTGWRDAKRAARAHRCGRPVAELTAIGYATTDF